MRDMDVKTNSLQAWLLAARPKTLAGAVVPVLIGGVLAYTDAQYYDTSYEFRWIPCLLCILFALTMQIGANFINDFFDFINGADDSSIRLGPRRACAQGWVKLDSMKRAIAISVILACLIGLPLVYYGGLEMIVVGVMCVLFCFLYTTCLSYWGLGDLLVLMFFGIIPICITYYIQLHTITWEVFIASVACGLVIDSLLIVNNYRDRENDRMVGKNTLVVRLGDVIGRDLYLVVGVLAILLGLVFAFNGRLLASILPIIYLVFHVYTYLRIKRIEKGKALNLCLSETARNIILYGLCVCIGLLF